MVRLIELSDNSYSRSQIGLRSPFCLRPLPITMKKRKADKEIGKHLTRRGGKIIQE